MKIKTLALAMTMSITATAQTPKLSKDNIEKVLQAMTLEEKASLLVGGEYDFWSTTAMAGNSSHTVPGAAGSTIAIPRLGIPETILTDGPAGVRINPTRPETNKTFYATGFPVGSCIAATWNTELAFKVGKAIGSEVKAYNCDVILGPGMNIHRNPLCGRNFEYYSEDPLLTGKIASGYVKGVQNEGAGVSIKHFAVNSQETNRIFVDEIVSPRAAREIYLRGFEIAVRESHPWTVMSSYNRINGVFAQANHDLLTKVLRDDWGFKGIVMTDWCGKREQAGLYTINEVKAGNDLLEPGSKEQVTDIVEGVKQGKLSMEDVDKCVRRMLEYIVLTPHFNGYKADNNPNLKANAIVSREVADEGMVLLKNNGVLPLGGKTQKPTRVSLYGTGSYNFLSGGVGSGCVHTPYIIDLVQGLKNVGIETTSDLTEIYKKYIDYAKLKFEADRSGFRWFEAPLMGDQKMPEIDITHELLKKQLKQSDMAIITISRQAGEGIDRKIDGEFNLTPQEMKMIQDVSTAYHGENKPVIVVINSGSVIETTSWSAYPDAILLAWQPGEEGGNSVADILTGKICPSGRLTMTWPLAATDHLSTKNFPQDIDLFTYENLGSGGAPIPTRSFTKHEEGIWIGYRFFDTFHRQVAYPFGYGLSYTTFEYHGMTVKRNGNKLVVSVNVKNTGSVAGKEVAQVYVAAPKGRLEKPAKELKAFAKTRVLKPGESQTLQMVLEVRDLASYDETNHQWLADAGTYTFFVGSNIEDIKGKSTINLPQYTEKTSAALAMKK